MKKNRIVLFGEMLADIFPDGAVLGGAPFNVARHLRTFGQMPVMITRTGHDALREEFAHEMTRLGMDVSGVQLDPAHPTGQVIVHITDDGHRFEIIPEQAYDHIHAESAYQVAMSSHPDMVYFGTLAQRGLESRLALERLLDESHCPCFLDLNLREPWYDIHTIRSSLLRANILKVNEDELNTVADLFRIPGTTMSAIGAYVIEQFELDYLLVTRGTDGAWAKSRHGVEARVDGVNLEKGVADTVGAGDGFSAVCMMGILRSWPMDTMLGRANAFAAALCQIRGAAPQSQDFYHPFIAAWQL